MIIFLGGSKDAGKTTTAEHIKKLDSRIAVVEPDVFFLFLPEHLSIFEKAPLCVELSAYCAQRLHQEGYIVIVAYPLTDSDYEKFRSLLTQVPQHQIFSVTLAPDKQKLLERLGLADDESEIGIWRRSIIEEQYDGVEWGSGVVNPAYPSYKIDNTLLTPDEAAQEVYAFIKMKLGE